MVLIDSVTPVASLCPLPRSNLNTISVNFAKWGSDSLPPCFYIFPFPVKVKSVNFETAWPSDKAQGSRFKVLSLNCSFDID